MKSLQDWLEDYGESHKNKTNILIHKICVPLIFMSIYFMLFQINLPMSEENILYLNWANAVYALALVFYFRLNIKVGLGFLVVGFVLGIISCFLWKFMFMKSSRAMFRYSFILFVFAWIGQFIGHHIEGKKPSFIKDLQFLLIGPIWVVYPKRRKPA
jgi:uncharacterized membrane protein YGL010W